MADVELVIKLPEEYHKAIMEIPVGQLTADMMIIRTGRPLPKGHGRLIDADVLYEEMEKEYFSSHIISFADLLGCVTLAHTVVFADK